MVFVILHYKNIDDTTECIESIKKQTTTAKIIIVDNNTLTEKQEKQLKKITTDIIKLEENFGFAKANNIGCKYAIDKYKPELIAVINNDIVLDDNQFIEKINKEYEYSKFDVLGPKINTDGGDSVNPFKTYDTLDEIELEIKKAKRQIKINSNLVLFAIYSLLRKVKKILIKSRTPLKNGECYQENISLHGCALIFSENYYQKFKDIFFNDTFLYHEEEFLSYRRDKYNLKFIYNPKISLFHKEGASLNNVYQNDRKKNIFRNNERIKSLEKLKIKRSTNYEK